MLLKFFVCLGLMSYGLTIGGLALHANTLVHKMAAALASVDPSFQQHRQIISVSNAEAMRIMAEYPRRFPDGPLRTKLHRTMAIMVVWFVLAAVGLLVFGDRLPG